MPASIILNGTTSVSGITSDGSSLALDTAGVHQISYSVTLSLASGTADKTVTVNLNIDGASKYEASRSAFVGYGKPATLSATVISSVTPGQAVSLSCGGPGVSLAANGASLTIVKVG